MRPAICFFFIQILSSLRFTNPNLDTIKEEDNKDHNKEQEIEYLKRKIKFQERKINLQELEIIKLKQKLKCQKQCLFKQKIELFNKKKHILKLEFEWIRSQNVIETQRKWLLNFQHIINFLEQKLIKKNNDELKKKCK
ncbi:hypothetical protein EDEG_03844 [Edhazardia aedis USNM 41457]|uniref:Uncharacterized protein n=1 Tax=Edhazardia aedis (strain USNM 41457) TaxID=1003232 RepID=J9D1A6_EDHAE|nr:hypothetical protein EDEG_03844 [Edhazardia aedis USNM 41457]|eukprot:EJW01611.1 hypothetical protein EDEG_03844 [Edhazardia aedis USNM 41457]